MSKQSKRNKVVKVPEVDKAEKVFLGARVLPELKQDLEEISRLEKRSLNAQVEIFLALGVEHHKQRALPEQTAKAA